MVKPLIHTIEVNHPGTCYHGYSSVILCVMTYVIEFCRFTCSRGVLDNNPEQIRNKLKISVYVLETTWKTYQKFSNIRLVLVPEIGVIRGK